MNIQFSKFIVPVLLIAVGLAAAMFILPVLGAVLIGAFALSGLLWLSGKIFAVFQGQTDYSEDTGNVLICPESVAQLYRTHKDTLGWTAQEKKNLSLVVYCILYNPLFILNIT